MRSSRKTGFTLIELMATIAIIAILAIVLIPTISGYISRSKKVTVIDQCKRMYNIIEFRKVEEGYEFCNYESEVSDLFEVNGSFYDYDLIVKDDFNRILKVGLENELERIFKGNNSEIIRDIEIDEIGNFKKLN